MFLEGLTPNGTNDKVMTGYAPESRGVSLLTLDGVSVCNRG